MKYVASFFSVVILFLNAETVFSARGDLGDENIRYTKHNLSSFWPADAGADIRTVKSPTQTEVCVFAILRMEALLRTWEAVFVRRFGIESYLLQAIFYTMRSGLLHLRLTG